MRCTAITNSGQQCRMFALTGEDKCVIHSQSDVAVKARQRPEKVLTKKDMIMELQGQVRKVKSSQADPLEKSREIRMILAQISDLKKDERSPEKKEESENEGVESFEKRVEKSMKDKEK